MMTFDWYKRPKIFLKKKNTIARDCVCEENNNKKKQSKTNPKT